MNNMDQLPLYHQRPLIIGIGGCSGSGKTTLARELTAQLNATLLPLDFYYRDLGHLVPEERARQNFDHPDSIESDLLQRHIEMLAEGQPIARPVYDFTTHTRVPDQTEAISPTSVLLVEGILALHYDSLQTLYDFSIYVHAPHDLCLKRRIHRDVQERGRTESCVREQYEATARPMADMFVLPSAANASVIVEGTDALDWSIEQVLKRLHQAGLTAMLQGSGTDSR